MLLLLALALTCSIAALRYGTRRRGHNFGNRQRGVKDCTNATRSSTDQDESAPEIQEKENDQTSIGACFMSELEEFSLGEKVHLPSDSVCLEKEDSAFERSNVRDVTIDTNENEINHLKSIVIAIREKEIKTRAQLSDVGPLTEKLRGQEELEIELTKRDSQIKSLLSQITSLEDYAAKVLQELSGKESLEQDLQIARAKIRDLHRERKNDANLRQSQLQILKQQLSKLQEIQELNSRKESNRLQKVLVLETRQVEVHELKQGIEKLSEDREKLTTKVLAAEKSIAEISAGAKSETQIDRANASTQLWNDNIDLKTLVEEEQASRFHEVEEVVYLRWVNACLQYELDMRRASCETPTAPDNDEANISPTSQETLKRGTPRSPRPVLMPLNVKEEAVNIMDNTSKIRFPIENPAVKISPRKQDFRKVFGRSLSTDSDPYIVSPKSRRNSLQMQDVQGNFVRAPSSLSTDSEFSITSPKPRRHSDSLPILEAYLQRKAYQEETIDFSRAGSKLSSSASFGGTFNSRRSFPGSIRKGILKHHSTTGVESNTNRTNASDSVASSFKKLTASNSISAKHPAFKNLPRLTSVAEEAMLGNQAEIPMHRSAQDKDNSVTSSDILLEKLSKEDIEKDSGGEGITARNLELRRLESHENSNSHVTAAMPSSNSSSRDCVAINHQSERRSGSSDASAALLSFPSDAGRTQSDPKQPCHLSAKDNGRVQRATHGLRGSQSLMPKEEHRTSYAMSKGKNQEACSNGVIKEIEDGSTFFLAVKADVRTKGDFVRYLATKIRDARYTEMEDVVAFVKWIDQELSLLVDKRAVVKHFDWPENTIDALREALFLYQEMRNLEVELTSFESRPNTSAHVALNSMLVLQEKTEDYVNKFMGSRDLAIVRYKKFNIPTYWMLDSGLLGKIKLASVQLAQKYMKRVLLELEHSIDIPAEKRSTGSLLVQAARFAFQAHQFAGGFDLETLSTFADLKEKGGLYNLKEQPISLEGCA